MKLFSNRIKAAFITTLVILQGFASLVMAEDNTEWVQSGCKITIHNDWHSGWGASFDMSASSSWNNGTSWNWAQTRYCPGQPETSELVSQTVEPEFVKKASADIAHRLMGDDAKNLFAVLKQMSSRNDVQPVSEFTAHSYKEGRSAEVYSVGPLSCVQTESVSAYCTSPVDLDHGTSKTLMRYMKRTGLTLKGLACTQERSLADCKFNQTEALIPTSTPENDAAASGSVK